MRLRGRVTLLAALVAVTTLGTGVGLAALLSPAGRTPPPITQRTGCADVRQTRGKETVIRGTERTETICGTEGKDIIYPEGGNDKIWGKEGDDRIWAKNRRPDLVSGGGGADWAELDSCDTAGGVETMVRRKNKCLGVGTARAKAASSRAIDYYSLSHQMAIECHSRGFERWGFQMRIAEEPLIYAVDTTKRPDWQFVTWIPLLSKWNGTAWEQVVVGNAFWLWDWTIDQQDRGFVEVRNFWRTPRGPRIRTGFIHLEPNTRYRMTMQIRWYKTKKTGTATIESVGGAHYGDYETDHTHESCTFPVTPLPTPTGGLGLSRAGAPGQMRAS
jgi:hypothetical protein